MAGLVFRQPRHLSTAPPFFSLASHPSDSCATTSSSCLVFQPRGSATLASRTAERGHLSLPSHSLDEDRTRLGDEARAAAPPPPPASGHTKPSIDAAAFASTRVVRTTVEAEDAVSCLTTATQPRLIDEGGRGPRGDGIDTLAPRPAD
ncbi:hypothetical protein CDD83_2646 [Cordyceps sp. RAO-2017]|nr:hypothetical protein CDD83_2646 [Cordyceps sp. RAO-2017]